MSFKQAKEGAEKWVKTLKKKGNDIVETDSDVEDFINFKSGARFVKLISKSAFAREGNLMSHCVASYHGKSGVDVYSLRDKKNMPHCTIEVQTQSGGNIQQIKGKGNGSIHPNYIKYVMQFLKKIGKEVRKSELTYLGYREVTPTMMQFYKSICTDLKYISYQGSLFIYVNQTFKK